MITLLTASVFCHRNSENIRKSGSSSHTRGHEHVKKIMFNKEKSVRMLLYLILLHKESIRISDGGRKPFWSYSIKRWLRWSKEIVLLWGGGGGAFSS